MRPRSVENRTAFFMHVTAGLVLYFTPHAVAQASHRRQSFYSRTSPLGRGTRLQRQFADLDYRFEGAAVLSLLCLARIVHALVVVLPRLAWGLLRNDPGEVLGQRVRCAHQRLRSQDVGDSRATLFPQRRFFASMEFATDGPSADAPRRSQRSRKNTTRQGVHSSSRRWIGEVMLSS